MKTADRPAKRRISTNKTDDDLVKAVGPRCRGWRSMAEAYVPEMRLTVDDDDDDDNDYNRHLSGIPYVLLFIYDLLCMVSSVRAEMHHESP